jgi:hypothetical protein
MATRHQQPAELETRRKSRRHKWLIGQDLRQIDRRESFPVNHLQHLQNPPHFSPLIGPLKKRQGGRAPQSLETGARLPGQSLEMPEVCPERTWLESPRLISLHRMNRQPRPKRTAVGKKNQRPDTGLETRRKSRRRKLLTELHLRIICRKPSPNPSSTGFSFLEEREPASFSSWLFRVKPGLMSAQR